MYFFANLNFITPFLSLAATIVTNTLENGGETVTCSAQNVRDMRWSIRSFATHIHEFVGFSTIIRSATQDEVIVPGITLSSVVITGLSNGIYSSVQSTMTVSPSLRQRGGITFICRGRILDDNNFYNSFFEQADIVSIDDDEDYPCKFQVANDH